jgi:DNA polymerase III epsilon subunit-like protein/predicted DNA-binding transcriptional regulator YafY
VKKRTQKTQWISQLRADAIALVNRSNSNVQPERRVSHQAALTVVDRSLAQTKNSPIEARTFGAIRSLSSFISLATISKTSVSSLQNADLLPVSHPYSTALHAMTASALRSARAQWIASDPLIDDSVRALVATAHSLAPGSIERAHAFARLMAAGPTLVPITAAIDVGDDEISDRLIKSKPLVASFFNLTGGNSRAARSMRARLQRRDRYGKFAFMGGGFSFKMKMGDGTFRSFSGRVVGRGTDADSQSNLVEVELARGSNGINVAGQIVKIPADRGTAVKAIIPQEGLTGLPDQGEVQADDVYVSAAEMIPTKTGAPSSWTPTKTAKDSKGNEYSTEWESPDGYVARGVGSYSHDQDYGNVGPGSAGWATHRQPQIQIARKELDFVDFPVVDTWAQAEDLISRDQGDYESDIEAYNALDGNDAAQAAWVAEQQAQERKNASSKPQILREESDAFFDQLTDEDITKNGVRFTSDGKDVVLRPTEVKDGTVKGTDQTGADVSYTFDAIQAQDTRSGVAKEEPKKDEPVADKPARQRSVDQLKSVRKAGVDHGALTDDEVAAQAKADADDFYRDGVYVVVPAKIAKGGYKTSKGHWKENDEPDGEPTKEPVYGDRAKAIRDRFVKERIETLSQLRDAVNAGEIENIPTVHDFNPDSDLSAADAFIKSLKAKQKFRFSYKGKDREITPTDVYRNKKTGTFNAVGLDENGESRTFITDQMAAPAKKSSAPVKKAEISPEGEAPAPSTEPTRISGPGVVDTLNQLQNAIDTDGTVRFDYNGKERVFKPQRIYTNPKNGKTNVVGFSETDGGDRTFSVDSIKPGKEVAPQPEAPAPAPAPAATAAEPAKIYESRVSGTLNPGESGPGWTSTVSATRDGEPFEWIHTPTTGPATHIVKESFGPPAFESIAPKSDGKPVQGYSAWRKGKEYGLPGGDMPIGGGPTWAYAMEAIEYDLPEVEELIAKKDEKINKEVAPAAPVAPSAQTGLPLDLRPVAQDDLTRAIEDAIKYKKDVAFFYHEKPRVVKPLEIVVNPKNNRPKLRGFEYATDAEKEFFLDKFAKPVDEKIKQTQLDDIINLPQEDLDEIVDALWPAPSPAPATQTEPQEDSGTLQEIDTRGSTAVRRAAYDPLAETLFIQFGSKDGKGGGVYEYPNVPKDFVTRFAESDSLGKMVPELKNISTGNKIDEFPAGAQEPELISTFDETPFSESTFDSFFDVPSGAYKVDVFNPYVPKGAEAGVSPDYTDDPHALSTRFNAQEIGIALKDAVLSSKDSEEPATGYGLLQFAEGEELVPAEALYDALSHLGLPAEILLAGIYDGGYEDGSGTNLERAQERALNEESIPSVSKKDSFTELIYTPKDRKDQINEARRINGMLGNPRASSRVVRMLDVFVEQNEDILDIADELMQIQDQGLSVDPDKVNFESFLVKRFDFAFSENPREREAFSAIWGLSMFLDGGDSIESGYTLDPIRVGIRNALSTYGGSDAYADELYEGLNETYGGYPEFVAGRERLSNGTDDLNAQSTAAAFTRLVGAAARSNVQPLYRYVNVARGDTAFNMYTTEGSIVDLDPRSFSSDADAYYQEAALSMSNRGGEIIEFVMQPGEGRSISAEAVSPFFSEREHVVYGTFEVVSVTAPEAGVSDHYIVNIKQVLGRGAASREGDESDPIAGNVIPDYGNISGWKEVRPGSQLGSNEGGFFKDQLGNEYYIKRGRSQSHADNEVLATALYRELGIAAPEQGIGLRDGEPWLVSPIVSSRRGFSNLLGNKEFMDEVREGFVIDAWLSNYDVTGWEYDNIVPGDENNEPIRIDNGGALRWRAQGGPKDWFDEDPTEIDTMRSPELSRIPAAADVFGDMSEDDVKESAKRLLDITPSRIAELAKQAIKDPEEAAEIARILTVRRERILARYGLDTVSPDKDILGDPTPLAISMGHAARDLQPEDVTATDSFTIERVFHDADTPKGKVSVEGYFPGHETQRKEWNEGTIIDVFRGAPIPPKGDKPALHRPKRPFEPKPPAFTGSAAQLLEGASGWEEVRDRLLSSELIFFDYETTGFPDRENGDFSTNQPVQLGAVKVVNGEVVDRINVYMNPGEPLGRWSRENLKRDGDTLVTDEWLSEQTPKADAHRDFAEWAGPNAVFVAHNAPFDLDVFNRTAADAGIEYAPSGVIDTLKLSQQFMPSSSQKVKPDPNGPLNHKLPTLISFFGGELEGWHTADADAEAVNAVLYGILNAIIGKPLPNIAEDAEKYSRNKENFDRARAEYAQALLDYETAKAVAAAWNCGGGGGINAAGDPYGDDCNVPTVDEILSRATPDASDFVDPEGLHSGPTDDSSSPLPDRGSDDLEDYIIPFPENVDPAELFKDQKFMPTLQQQNIIAAWLTGENVVVLAKAGTGKTTTLTIGARVISELFPSKKLLYIAYNRSVADEARAKFPPNTEVKTSDAIAYNFIKTQQPTLFKKFGDDSAVFNKVDIAKMLGLSSVTIDEEKFTDVDLVTMVQDVIFNFEISSDGVIGPQHFDAADVPTELMGIIEPAVQAYWTDILTPTGKLPFAFNEMKKLWSMSSPDFSKLDSGVNVPIDIVMLDEAQDTNDAVGSVVISQPGQVIMVGDPDQAIYQFNGAKDQLQNAVAPYRLPLTESWRYGPEIGGFANRFLALKERVFDVQTNRGIGNGPTGEVVPENTMGTADAVIVRSNAGAFGAILEELERGRRVGVTKSFYADLKGFIQAAEWLKAGGASSGAKRPTKMPADLKGFKTWDAVVNEAAKGDDSDLGVKTTILVDIVEAEGIAGLYAILDKIAQIESVSAAKKQMDSTSGVSKPDEFAIPDNVGPGAYGQLVENISFSVDPTGITITGKKTFDYKEAIKSSGARWNATGKAWKIPATTDAERIAALTKLQNALRDLEGYGSTAEERTAQGIDVVVSTAHQMKGLEFGNVRVGKDFRGPYLDKTTQELVWPKLEEFNLAYVTATRAISALDPGSLSWIYKYTGDSDESPFPEAKTDETQSAEAEVVPDVTPEPSEPDEVVEPSSDGSGGEEPPEAPPAEVNSEPSDEENAIYAALDAVYYAISDSADSDKVKDFGAAAGVKALKDLKKNYKDILSANQALSNLIDEIIDGINNKAFRDPEDGVIEGQKKLPVLFGREPEAPVEEQTSQDDSPNIVTAPDDVNLEWAPPTPEEIAEVELSEPVGAFNLDFIRERFAEVDKLITETVENMKRPSSKSTAVSVRQELDSTLRDLISGNITIDEAYEILSNIADGVPEIPVSTKNPDAEEFDNLKDFVASIRDAIEESKFGRRLSKNLPPPELTNKAGQPMGTSKNDILIRPGMRIRDKNGFAGRVLEYNKTDWIGVFVRFELDPRDPASVKKGKWGPGIARYIRTASTLEVIDEDGDPWIDVRTDAQKEKDQEKGTDPRPPSFDQQLEIYRNMIERRSDTAWSGSESERSDDSEEDSNASKLDI